MNTNIYEIILITVIIEDKKGIQFFLKLVDVSENGQLLCEFRKEKGG